MLSKQRRCPECDYTWSAYLDFPTCPRCGSDLVAARLFLEKNRTRKTVIISIILGTLIFFLANLLLLLFE